MEISVQLNWVYLPSTVNSSTLIPVQGAIQMLNRNSVNSWGLEEKHFWESCTVTLQRADEYLHLCRDIKPAAARNMAFPIHTDINEPIMVYANSDIHTIPS